MPREVFVMDITDFRPMVSKNPLEFLRWITRKFRADDPASIADTAASRMQAAGGSNQAAAIELIGAWYAAGVTGHDQFRAFSLYECHGGWEGGWRRMLELYENVPDSLFLSPIDGVRFGATTVPLIGAPGCPTTTEIQAGPINGTFAMVEFADVRIDAGLDYLAAVQEMRQPVLADHGYQLAGLYEVAFSRRQVCTLWCGDIDGHVTMMRARDAARGLDDVDLADPRIAEWDRISAQFLAADAREYLLAAYAGPPLSPSQ